VFEIWSDAVAIQVQVTHSEIPPVLTMRQLCAPLSCAKNPVFVIGENKRFETPGVGHVAGYRSIWFLLHAQHNSRVARIQVTILGFVGVSWWLHGDWTIRAGWCAPVKHCKSGRHTRALNEALF